MLERACEGPAIVTGGSFCSITVVRFGFHPHRWGLRKRNMAPRLGFGVVLWVLFPARFDGGHVFVGEV